MSFPDVAEAFAGWTSAMQFKIVTKVASDFELLENPVETIWFRGVMEPIHPRELLIKPEGQRTWRWWRVWTQQELDIDGLIQNLDGTQYRVMTSSDWSNSGYREYEMVQQPTS